MPEAAGEQSAIHGLSGIHDHGKQPVVAECSDH
jgi:hypothetical protein